MTGLDSSLLEAIGPRARVFWGGEKTPLPHFRAGPQIYDRDEDFRLPAGWHGSFDVVYLTEQDIGQLPQWPLVLDEALRLIDGEGLVFLRFTQGRFCSIFQLMNYLWNWAGATVEVASERTWDDHDNLYVLTLRVRRTAPIRPVRSVSFGIITDGRKPASVGRFVDSVQRLERLESVAAEILVCGPPGSIDHVVMGRERTRLVRQPAEFTELGWITRKKNLLVQEAAGDVVVIAHDRYELAADFLTALLDFGPDFSVLVCRQETFDGRRFPDWVSIGAQWSFADVGMMAYGDWDPGAYVNGGVMVARREVLAEHPWNELLFWNQAEDVELSRRLSAGGVVPRLARDVVARTDLSREDQMSAFEMLPSRDGLHTAPGKLDRYLIGTRFRPRGRDALAMAQQAGVSLLPGWKASRGGPRWTGTGDPELALTVLPWDEPMPDLELRLRLADSCPASVAGVRVNGRDLELLPGSGATELRAAWPAGLLPRGHTARVELLVAGEEPVELRELVLDVAGRRLPTAEPVHLGHSGPDAAGFYGRGWTGPEGWGRWTSAEDAWLRLPVECDGSDRTLVADVMALVPEAVGEQRVVVRLGDAPMAVWVFTRSATREERRLRIPAKLLEDGWLDLRFEITSPTPPRAAGIPTEDGRVLGLGVAALTLVDPEEDR